MGLIEAIGKGPAALDTSVFIYFIEQHPRYYSIVEPLFEAIDQGRLKAAASAVTLLEVLVVPYRAGRLDLAQRYEEILANSRGLQIVGIDNSLMRVAAMIRAKTRIKTPDAIQLAAAMRSECATFVTNDRDLPSVGNIGIVQLSG